jgi:serine/threonine protein kinase
MAGALHLPVFPTPHVRPPGAELAAGDRVGIFRIVRRIAPSYYDAEDAVTEKRVTVEVGDRDDSRLVDVRYVRAQSILEPLSHPGIAQILDHGTLYDERPWMVAQRPHGATLSELFGAGRLTRAEAAALVRGVAGVLAYVHAHQIVHGNLRPHQIVVIDDDPRAMVPVSVGGWASLRSPGIPAFGDPPVISVYVAPEHAVGPIDQRADVYTLGAIAYRGLTGVFPDVARDLVDGRDALGSLVNEMLSADPRARPTAAQVCGLLMDELPTARRRSASA